MSGSMSGFPYQATGFLRVSGPTFVLQHRPRLGDRCLIQLTVNCDLLSPFGATICRTWGRTWGRTWTGRQNAKTQRGTARPAHVRAHVRAHVHVDVRARVRVIFFFDENLDHTSGQMPGISLESYRPGSRVSAIRNPPP
jgi:hypothetical protein